MRGVFPMTETATGMLADIVLSQRERIARLWAKRLRAELIEVDLPGREIRRPLDGIVAELGRVLRERGEDAVTLFAESIRSHGIVRFEQRFDPEDLAREMAALHGVLLRVIERARGEVPEPVAELLAAIIGEATGAVLAAYTRALRTEEVRFRDAAAMESVLHHFEVGVLLVDREGTVVFATPSVTRLVGLPARTFVGAKAAEALRLVLAQLHARHPSDGRPFKPADMPAMRALEERSRVSGVWMAIDKHPTGEEVVLEMNATPLLDEESGEPYGVVQTLTDRTELAARTREQQDLVRRATEGAHALNNSLNVLRLKIGLLRKDASPEALDHLDEIERALQGATDRVRWLEPSGAPPPDSPPPAPAPEHREAAHATRPALGTAARRVLVVDDDLENAQVMAEVLSEEGYETRVAHDGREARDLWSRETFDAALLDAIMPDVSGWELARQLRATAPRASLALVTGADVRGMRSEDLAQVDAVFRKPVDAGTLDDFLSSHPPVE